MRHATVTASHMCMRLGQRACPYHGTEANFLPAGLVLEETKVAFFKLSLAADKQGTHVVTGTQKCAFDTKVFL